MVSIVAVSQINYRGAIIRAGETFSCDEETATRLVKSGSAKKKSQSNTSKAKRRKK